MTKLNLLGLAEIAELYGVNKNIASGWTRRHDFPQPCTVLRMGPVWLLEELLEWRQPMSYEERHHLRCAHCGQSSEGDYVYPLLPPTGEPKLKMLCESCNCVSIIEITRSGFEQGKAISIIKETK
jgi:hypothetical protein